MSAIKYGREDRYNIVLATGYSGSVGEEVPLLTAGQTVIYLQAKWSQSLVDKSGGLDLAGGSPIAHATGKRNNVVNLSNILLIPSVHELDEVDAYVHFVVAFLKTTIITGSPMYLFIRSNSANKYFPIGLTAYQSPGAPEVMTQYMKCRVEKMDIKGDSQITNMNITLKEYIN